MKNKDIVKNIKGKLTISATNHKDYMDADSIKLVIEDNDSMLRVIEVVIPYKNLIQAIAGLAFTPIKYTVYDTTKLGKKLITESVDIEPPEDSSIYKEDILKYLQPHIEIYEKEGWKVETNLDTQTKYHLTLRKWV